jgi:hypothetical protein
MNTPILYENGRFWVTKAKHGFEVYENGITHATRRGIFGSEGTQWFDRAKAHADLLASKEAA